jgi:long-chain acyl-CoA synthetase
VYPTQVESVLESHDDVWRACVVGVPDDYQMMSVKAFVVLNDKDKAGEAMKTELQAHCKGHLIKWSVPKHIEFIEELPKTLVGKVAYTKLEKSGRANKKSGT